MAEGHLKGKLSDWELDHDLPISSGGCPDCEDNLRMELWPEAKLKDVVENYVYHQVCSDRLSLAEGQRMVLDWRHVDVHGSRAGSRAKEKK